MDSAVRIVSHQPELQLNACSHSNLASRAPITPSDGPVQPQQPRPVGVAGGGASHRGDRRHRRHDRITAGPRHRVTARPPRTTQQKVVHPALGRLKIIGKPQADPHGTINQCRPRIKSGNIRRSGWFIAPGGGRGLKVARPQPFCTEPALPSTPMPKPGG